MTTVQEEVSLPKVSTDSFFILDNNLRPLSFTRYVVFSPKQDFSLQKQQTARKHFSGGDDVVKVTPDNSLPALKNFSKLFLSPREEKKTPKVFVFVLRLVSGFLEFSKEGMLRTWLSKEVLTKKS